MFMWKSIASDFEVVHENSILDVLEKDIITKACR